MECGGDVAKTFIMQVKCKDRFGMKTTCERRTAGSQDVRVVSHLTDAFVKCFVCLWENFEVWEWHIFLDVMQKFQMTFFKFILFVKWGWTLSQLCKTAD